MSRRWAGRLLLAACVLAAGWELAERLAPKREFLGPLGVPVSWAPGPAAPFVGFGDCSDPNLSPKRPGEYLLVMSGGSTVAVGFQSPPLPEILAERLRKAGLRRVRVLNCGVIAQNSSQELARLLYRIVDLKPDALVVYDGGNDILNPLYMDPRPGYPNDFIAWQRNPILDKETPFWAEFVARSPLLRWAFGPRLAKRIFGLERLRREAGYGTPEWRQALARTYVGNLVKLEAVARTFGIRPVFFLQPVLFDTPPVPGFEAYTAAHMSGLGEPKPLDWRAHSLDVKARIRRLAAVERSRGRLRDFVDMSGALDGLPGVFVDHIHVNAKGNARMADVLYGRLRALGIPRRGPA